jgi:predicted nucleotidyltransferase
MDKTTVLRIIDNFIKAIQSKGIKIDKLILFGSYADETHEEGSDIDLVVISDDFAGKDYWERIDILSDAIFDVFQPIEATAMTSNEFESETSIISEFAKKGHVVFEAA